MLNLLFFVKIIAKKFGYITEMLYLCIVIQINNILYEIFGITQEIRTGRMV